MSEIVRLLGCRSVQVCFGKNSHIVNDWEICLEFALFLAPERKFELILSGRDWKTSARASMTLWLQPDSIRYASNVSRLSTHVTHFSLKRYCLFVLQIIEFDLNFMWHEIQVRCYVCI